jgi:hypothetical protein
MFAFPLFLAADHTGGSARDLALVAAWVFAVSGLAFSYYAAFEYVPLARAALREGRAARGGNPPSRVGSAVG